MTGLRLSFDDLPAGTPEPTFWACFGPIRYALDPLYWVFEHPPWMGVPLPLLGNEDELFEPFEGEGTTSVSLWRPGMLGRWADHFGEEWIVCWAVNPADDPRVTAAAACRFTVGHSDLRYLRDRCPVALMYTDERYWDLFARDSALLDKVRVDHAGSATIRCRPSPAAVERLAR